MASVHGELTRKQIDAIITNGKLLRAQFVDNEISKPYGGMQVSVTTLVTSVTSLYTTLISASNVANLP